MKAGRRALMKRAMAMAVYPVSSRILAATRQEPLASGSVLPLDRAGFCVDVAPLQGAERSITDYSGFHYCPLADAMLLFGGGHAATPEDVVLRFSLSSLSWAADYPTTPKSLMLTPTSGDSLDMSAKYPSIEPGDPGWPKYLTAGKFWQVPGQVPAIRPISRHTYTGFVWSSAIRRMVLTMGNNGTCYGFPNTTTGGNMAEYDPVTRTWQDTGEAGGPSAAAWCEDPVSGVLLVHLESFFAAYDPRTRRYAGRIALNKKIPYFGYAGNLVYYPPTDKFYYFARDIDAAIGYSHVWEYGLDRSRWLPVYTKPTANSLYGFPMETNWHPPAPGSKEAGYAYDAKNELIVGAVMRNVVCAFKPTGNNTGVWYQQEAPGAAPTISYCQAYAPGLDAHFTLARASGGVRTFAIRWDPAKAVKCVAPVPVSVSSDDTVRQAAAGIATGLAHDVDLKKHPDVIAYVDFKDVETVNADLGKSNVWRPGKPWYAISKLSDGSKFCVSDPEFVTYRGLNFMRFSGTQRLIAAYLWAGKGVRHAFCRYVFLIESDVPEYITDGVKLPGFAGEYEDTVIHPPHAGRVAFSWRMNHSMSMALRDYLYDGTTGSGYGNLHPYNVLLPIGEPIVLEQELDVDAQRGRVWINGRYVADRNVITDVDIEMLFLNIYHGGRGFAKAPVHYRLAGACIARSYIGPPPELASSLPALPSTWPKHDSKPSPADGDGLPTSPYIRDHPRFGVRR